MLGARLAYQVALDDLSNAHAPGEDPHKRVREADARLSAGNAAFETLRRDLGLDLAIAPPSPDAELPAKE